MKIRVIAALSAAALLPLTGTAAAASGQDPVEGAGLVANALYEAGQLPRSTCAEKPVKRNHKPMARAYINAVVACLDRTWGKHLTAAGLEFQKPRVKYLAKVPKGYCDLEIDNYNAQAYYCEKNRTLIFQLGKDWLDDPHDLWLFSITSRMYGIHVQELVGIGAALDEESYDDDAEERELVRRYSLQSDCFAGAFMKSVWPLKGRSGKDWKTSLNLLLGDEPGDDRVYGKTANIRAWTKRGFATGDPGSCNTWTASASKVA
ncbi:neutral zinc metallopeptidase [Nonomuraea sp. NPDC049725]|uniref:neutral zinc metallopeptidase n=1 Tax=Nonomuraea sp. NPDC049725 TaxID=3154508 RepID=UPI003440F430